MLESEIQRKYVTHAKKRGCKVIKLSSEFHNGLPDTLTIARDSISFYIEFKKPGEKPSDLQKYVHREFRSLGHWVFCFDEPGQAEKCLDLILMGETPTYVIKDGVTTLTGRAA